MKPIIYKTVNQINGKIYVGSTINPTNMKYLGSGVLIHYAIVKYGKENFTREILEECELSEKSQRETYWINLLKSYDRAIGYNLSRSGVGPNAPFTEDRKERSRLSNLGKKRSLAQKKNISLGKLGIKQTVEHSKNMGLAKRGSKWSEDQKKRLSELRRGKKLSEHHKQRIKECKSDYYKKTREMFIVIQKDMKNKFIKEWKHLQEIKTFNEKWRISYIEDAIIGKRKSAYRFKWERK